MRSNMGSPESTSKCQDWSYFDGDGLIRKLRGWGFDFTFPGDMELISVEIVDSGALHNVWPSWIGVAAIFSSKSGGLGQKNWPQIALGGRRGFGDGAFESWDIGEQISRSLEAGKGLEEIWGGIKLPRYQWPRYHFSKGMPNWAAKTTSNASGWSEWARVWLIRQLYPRGREFTFSGGLNVSHVKMR